MADTNLNLNLNINPHDNIDDTTGSVLMEELKRMGSENKKLTEMLIFLCENYTGLQGHLTDLMRKNSENSDSKSKKRKAECENFGGGIGINGNIEGSSCSDGNIWKRPGENEMKSNVSRVCVRTDPSDASLIVKDGHQWRKYGQKVTRDNPSPRAYYKCSFAPSCPVKKKVQRSVEDPCLVVAIYEGVHNHHHPCQAEVSLGLNQGSVSSSPSPILESTQHGLCTNAKKPNPGIDMAAFQQLLVEKMANSLMRDQSFTTALTMAVSTRILDHDLLENWENTIY